MAALITPSLYSQWFWHLQTDGTKEEFLSYLRKEPQPTSEAMQIGIDFEDSVRAVTDGGETEDPCVAEVAEIVRNGYWQSVLSKRVDDIFLYGRADVIKRDTIYDIKRCGKYDVGKYQDSIQHDLYMECSGIKRFVYVVCDGNAVYQEEYRQTEQSRNELFARIREMVNWINADADYRQAFAENWTAKE